jgi:hypothetical protein
MASNPQLLSGARGVILSGTNALAIATDITINVRHNVTPTFVIGDMNAAAIDSLAYDVDVSIGRVIPVNSANATPNPSKTPPVAGSNQSTGSFDGAPSVTAISAIGLGLEETIAAITSAADLYIVLQDRVTGATIASVQGCRFSGRTQSMNANAIATERLSFVGIYDAGYTGTNGTPDNTATGGYGLG